MSIAKKRKDYWEEPQAEDVPAHVTLPPPIPAGMMATDDPAAHEQMIALDQLSIEDKRALWLKLSEDLPEFAKHLSMFKDIFQGRAEYLNVEGLDKALHDAYKARSQKGAPGTVS